MRHLSKYFIRPSLYISLIVKSRSNPILEQPVLSNTGKMSWLRKQREPFVKFELVIKVLIS